MMPRPKPQHRYSSAGVPLLNEYHIQSQYHLQSSPSSRQVTPSPLDAKTRSAYAPGIHGPRSPPQPREISSLVQSNRPQREETEHMNRILSAESQRRLHGPILASNKQHQAFPGLRTKDILKNRRLQQVTGFLPRKVDLWDDRELPPDELYRLAWAMALPSPFPAKRPRGEVLMPIAHQVKKT